MMELNSKNKIVFYDAVHKKIVISDPLAQELIFTKEFQRLKHIKQLGTLFLLLNSSCHTRFSHSIGTYYLINKLLRNKRFHYLDLKACQEVEIAGLLHDLGHGFFSHAFEKVFPYFVHEEFTVKILRNKNGEIYPILKKYGLNIDRIANLVLKKTKQNDWGQHLISHQFDFDRLDYLMRDRYFLGLTNLNINLDRLFDNIVIEKKRLIFHENALLDLESYLHFRFYIFKNFFWNEDNILFDNLFIAIFQRLKDLIAQSYVFAFSLGLFYKLLNTNDLIDLETFLQLNDHSVFTFFQLIQLKEKDPILLKLINLFLNPSYHWPLCHKKEDIQKQIEYLKQKKWDSKYFVYSTELNLSVYQINVDEILILNASNQVKKMSEVSLFFNHNHQRYKKINLALKLI